MRLELLEVTVLFVLFALLIHLVTSAPVDSWDMLASMAIVLITVAFAFRPLFSKRDSGRRLWAVSSALMGGFWVFTLFRYMGFVRWPMAHPPDLQGYLNLFYYHFVLSITVLVPLLIVRHKIRDAPVVTWGNWKMTGFSAYGLAFLLLSAIGLWLLALHDVLVTDISVTGPVAGFIVICLLKAFLTGFTEEVCYRGIIQPLAITHIGIPLGIVLQSCLFTAFHMHLGAVYFPKSVFLFAVMALGLLFGAVTRLTSGIGWACIIHIAINVVIEWQNLS